MKPIITIVGSRKADTAAIKRASLLASSLQASSWIRTGDAWGIDAAVRSACPDALVYKASTCDQVSKEIYEQALAIMLKVHPNPKAVLRLDSYKRNLLVRNVFEVLGTKLNQPSNKLYYWTPNGELIGGTATTVRIARMFNIPCEVL